MKLRKGFVSNSSCASFIVTWESLEGIDNVKDAIHSLFGFGDYCSSKVKKVVPGLIDSTKKLKDGIFETAFFTTMFNDYEDFGEGHIMLIYYLSLCDKYRLLSKRVIDEG